MSYPRRADTTYAPIWRLIICTTELYKVTTCFSRPETVYRYMHSVPQRRFLKQWYKTNYLWVCLSFFLARQRPPSPPVGHGLLIYEVSISHTLRHTTVGRTPLDEWSARRRDLYLTTHNTHNRQTSMPPVGFESTISAGERPQTQALERAANGTGSYLWLTDNKSHAFNWNWLGVHGRDHVSCSAPCQYCRQCT